MSRLFAAVVATICAGCGSSDSPLPRVHGHCSSGFVAAIQRGDSSAVKSALASVEDSNCVAESEFGDSPLTLAVESQHGDVVELLLHAGAKSDFPDGKPLRIAAAIDDSTALEVLLGAGANPNIPSRLGAPLCWAVRTHHARSAALLLERGADPNVRCADERGNPPVLMIALRTPDANLITSLVRAGADLNARDDDGHTVSEAATGKPELLRLLSGGTSAVPGESPPVLPLPPNLSSPPRRPIRVGGSVVAPKKILDVPPTYPPIARSARIQGDVTVEIVIADDGSVRDAKVVRSIPLLDAAAVAAVRQ